MDRRRRAQDAQRQVEGRVVVRVDGRNQRHGLRRSIRDIPHGREAIEPTDLGGDVAGREVVPQVAAGSLGPAFGDDATVPVLVEPIDHHPLVAGEIANQGDQRPQQTLAARVSRQGGLPLGQGTEEHALWLTGDRFKLRHHA